MRLFELRRFAVLAMLAGALSLGGCLSAQEQDVVTYDPATDDFHALMVLTDIRGTDSNDLDYFSRIYQNRDRLIAPSLIPIPIIDPMFLRISDDQCALVSMFDQPTGDLQGIKTGFPLDGIAITPGSLFVQDGKLCYYQAVKVPGKTLDAAIQQLFSVAMDFMKDRASKFLQKELDRRAAGGALKTWPEVTDKLIHGIDETLAARKEHPAAGGTPAKRAGVSVARFNGIDLAVLQTRSIQRLKAAIDSKSLKISRQGPQLIINLPFEPADATAIEQATQKVNDHLAKLLAQPGAMNVEDRKRLESLNNSAKVMRFTAQPDGLSLHMDLVEMARAQGTVHRQSLFETLQHQDAQPDAQHKPGTPDPVAYARNHHLPLDENLTAPKIIAQFSAGKLAGTPLIVAPAPQLPPVQGFSISAAKSLHDLLH